MSPCRPNRKVRFLFLFFMGWGLAGAALAVPAGPVYGPRPLAGVTSEWKQSLTLFGEAKYKPGFDHFDYVNVKAPKRGTLKQAWPMTFDSLNMFILKGVKAPGVNMMVDSLMTASYDEPQSYYPLLAERYRSNEAEGWIEFQLNPKARWWDGKPVLPEDVVFTLDILKSKGDPVYRISYAPLGRAEVSGPDKVKIYYSRPVTREAPILAASLVVLPKHYYDKVEFDKTTLTPPLGSGPYRVGTMVPGRSVQFERVKDYWGKDLPVNRGRYNFDHMRFDVYRDTTVALQALKAGEYDLRQENVSRNWATAYDVPAVRDGRLVMHEFPNGLPQGMQGFFYNLRKPYFKDRRVREAVALTLDFEWVNKALFYGAYRRSNDFFQNTPFAASGVPEGAERAFLQRFPQLLPPGILDQPFKLPHTDGSGRDRRNLLKAQALLNAAGFTIKNGKRIDPATGQPLRVEFLLNQDTMQRVIAPMRQGLERLGIRADVRQVDDAQFQRRVDTRDFDIITGWINYGILYPGVEQLNSWGSAQAEMEGSNNVSGLKNALVDAAVSEIANARTLEELTAPAKVLDRLLLWEHVVIPHWCNDTYRVAYWKDRVVPPAVTPRYNLGLDDWWSADGR